MGMPATKPEKKKPSFFKMRAQMLEQTPECGGFELRAGVLVECHGRGPFTASLAKDIEVIRPQYDP